MNYKIHQIYYDTESFTNCYNHPNVELFYNSRASDFYENDVIIHLRPQMDYFAYFGVWSHRHRFKIQGQKFTFEEMEKRLAPKNINEAVDVLAFQRFLRNGRIFSGIWEKKYRDMFNLVMVKLGLSYRFPNKPKFIVMQNHFITRGWIYADYVDTVLKPATEIIREMPESLEKTNYKDGSYNYRPFLCERLFSAYLEERNYNCQQW